MCKLKVHKYQIIQPLTISNSLIYIKFSKTPQLVYIHFITQIGSPIRKHECREKGVSHKA